MSSASRYSNDTRTEAASAMARLRTTSRTLVFYIQLDDYWKDSYKFETALRLLPTKARKQVLSKRHEDAAETALANQLLQRYICSLLSNTTSVDDLCFVYGKFGKPALKDASFKFSMSNQHGYTAICVDTQGSEVGIDLASCKDVDSFGSDYVRQFADIFHQQEFQVLQNQLIADDKKLLFTEYWALKEGYTKNLGVGLNGDLSSYNFKSVPLLQYPTSFNSIEQAHYPFQTMGTHWDKSSQLYIYDTLEAIDIWLTRLNKDIVINVCGEIRTPPTLVRVDLETMVEYFRVMSTTMKAGEANF